MTVRRRIDEPYVQKVFGRRGSIEILNLLTLNRTMRFSAIDTALPTIAPQVVSARLADLREAGMLNREVKVGPPLSTTYSLTALGERLAEAAAIVIAVSRDPDLPALEN